MDIQQLINKDATKKMEKDLEALREVFHDKRFAGLDLVSIFDEKKEMSISIGDKVDNFRTIFWGVSSPAFILIRKKVLQHYIDIETELFYKNVMELKKER